MSLHCKAGLLIGIPLFAYFVWGKFQSWASGNARWTKTHAGLTPLNKRWQGYSSSNVGAYWGAMDADGLLIERRYLRFDLFFPFVYGTTLMGALVIAAQSSQCSWLMVPAFGLPAAAMLADWTENLTQLSQLERYMSQLPLQDERIVVASWATRIKLVSFVASGLLLVALVAWMFLPS